MWSVLFMYSDWSNKQCLMALLTEQYEIGQQLLLKKSICHRSMWMVSSPPQLLYSMYRNLQ